MQRGINFVLKILKWPLAILMVALFVPILNADTHLIRHTLSQNLFLYFVAPMMAMIGVWFVIPGLNGSHLAIFEHEFTHMLAALMTFHKPAALDVQSDKGGSFSYYGEGNWLITLAPYFIPTFPLFLMIVSLGWTLTGHQLPELFIPVLGFMFGYHLVSNATQIHSEQTDFPKAGWIFSVLFLPTANLFTFGIVWAFAVGGWRYIDKYFELIGKYILLLLEKVEIII